MRTYLVHAHSVELKENWQVEVSHDNGGTGTAEVEYGKFNTVSVDFRAYAEDGYCRDEGYHKGNAQWYYAHRLVGREIFLRKCWL